MQFRKYSFISLLTTLLLINPAIAQEKFDAEQLVTDLRFLSSDSLQGRKTGSPGNKIAQDYILRRYAENKLLKFGESYKHTFGFVNVKEENKRYDDAVNIFGYLPGKSQPEKFMVVSAHYDHLGVKNGLIHNGADDNASGVTAVLAASSYFKQHQPEHSIIFVAFGAEEMGLQGAKAFVANPPVELEKIVLNINLDMVSRNAKKELFACGTSHYPQLKPFVECAAKDAKIKLRFGHDTPDKAAGDDWTFSSDHGPFHQAKIPFIYFGVEDHRDYHKPTDDFENIEIAFFVDVVNFIIDAIGELDRGL
jgi:Zn-dependent M28 family amino/carboxypeptidase